MTRMLPASRALLANRIATKQRQQADRWQHLATLLALIEHHDLELTNLQAQLNNDAERTACPQNSNAAAEPHAPSADAASSKPKTPPSCPPTPPKPGQPAPCQEEN